MFKRQPQAELTIGLDIGSTAVRVAVGQYLPGAGKKNLLQVMGAVEVSSEGVHRGVVTSIEEVVSSVSSALEEAERMVGVPIESAWVGVTGNNTLFQGSKGVVAVAKTNGEIALE
jgi:cell division protein FtsA